MMFLLKKFINMLTKFKINLKIIFYFSLLVILSSCNDFKPPIEADDFGFPKISISSLGQNVQGQKENELSEWTFSGYAYNGGLAVIMVYNMDRNNYYYVWSSWFGGGKSVLDGLMKSNSAPLCCIGGTYNSNTGECINSQYCSANGSGYENVVNAPCVFSQGQGLYLLLTDPSNKDITDPNSYANINRNPSSMNFFTLALWQYTGMYQNGELANGYIGGYVNNMAVSYSSRVSVPSGVTPSANTTYTDLTIPTRNIGGNAYFKILDRYYDDNSGFYQVSLKNGFSRTVTPPIASVISLVTTALKNATEKIFNSLVNNGHYKVALRAAITIYIIVSGILFLGGVIAMTQVELMNRMIKLIIVIQLLTTETSWNVFNNYFFRFFTDGVNEIINIVAFNISGSLSSSGAQGLTFFDAMLGLLFSDETTMKIVALLVSIPSGIIAVMMIYIAFALFIISMAKGLMLYLLAFIVTSLLISIAPVFISLMLFSPTRSLFDQWIKQLVGYFFQPLIVFAALSMMGQNIINSMYRLLGYKICYSPWVTAAGNTILKTWQICSSLKKKEVIPVPGYGFWDPLNPDKFYIPYEFKAERYIDLPFLIPKSGTLDHDQALIEAFASTGPGLNMPILYNSFMLLVIAFLLFKFYDLVPQLAKGLAGMSDDKGPDDGIAGVARSSVNDMLNATHQFSQAVDNKVKSSFEKTGIGKKYYKMRSKISDLFKDIEPGKQNRAAIFWGKYFGNPGEFIFRSIIPIGSLKTTPEKEAYKQQHERKYGKTPTLQNMPNTFINDIKGDLIKEINKKAADFDRDVKDYKNQVRDKIGGKVDPFLHTFQRGLKDSIHPLNLIDRNYVKKDLRTSMERLDQRSLYKASLRYLGVLEKELFIRRYGEDGAKNLSEGDRKSIEASLSWDEIKELIARAPRDQMLDTLKKVDELNKDNKFYSMLDHYRKNF